jgi:dTDP-4-amino-4,6-dideoxygalactose transaminase
VKKHYPPCDLPDQFKGLRNRLMKKTEQIFSKGVFVSGQELERFEKNFAKYIGTRWAVGTSSGTEALRIALLASGVGRGDEVMVPAMTFVATAEAVVQVGARPVLVDIDQETYCIDAQKIEKAITRRTKAIIPVHLYGQPADLKTIRSVTRKNRMIIIEDSAQAHGARIGNRYVGSFGRFGCFSFYPTKNLGAFGDGGMIVGSSKADEIKIRRLINHGGLKRDEHLFIGYASRLDELQAAWLNIKLELLSQWNQKRRMLAQVYESALNEVDCILPCTGDKTEHVFHQYVIRCRKRNQVVQRLKKNGVGAVVYYPKPIHLVSNMRFLGYQKRQFPVSEDLAETSISLPMYPELSLGDVRKIGGRVRKAIREKV